MGDMGRHNGFLPEQIALGRSYAAHYASLGYQPLPSCSHAKKPMLPYADFWEGGAPSVDQLWDRHPSGNVQVMLGRYWGLCVLDLDGPEGIARFRELCVERGVAYPKTWTVQNDRKTSKHLWFGLPRKGVPFDLRRKRLWGEKHSGIEFLCDRSLVMAPPSIHPEKGTRYCFEKGRGMDTMRRPALLPHWILALPEMQPIQKPTPMCARPCTKPMTHTGKLPCRPADVLASIPIEHQAKSWGLRLTSKPPNADGWIQCHDIDREDINPSAIFHPDRGLFWSHRFEDGKAIGFFELGVALGHYSDWYSCCVDMGRTYLPGLFSREGI